MSGGETRAGALRRHRDTIWLEDAEVLQVSAWPGEQYVMRLHAPGTARDAVPGSFVHLRCDAALPMRRPLSIMRAHRDEGWIEVLFKIVGDGLRSLGHKAPGDRMSLLGPIGRGFLPSPERSRALLIGGGVGIPPMVFLAEVLRREGRGRETLVLMGSEIPFPFDISASAIPSEWLPADVTGAMPLLEEWGIACRLASGENIDRTFRGYVTDLAAAWLDSQSPEELDRTEIFCCGPTPMLAAVAGLARRFGLPCQAALEEYMACGVGGCAGCTVLVQTPDGPAMKRVCVDGPVFDAAAVFTAA